MPFYLSYFVILSAYALTSSTFGYFAFFLYFIFDFFSNYRVKKISNFLDLLPITIVLIWLYGVVVGLVNDNDNVFRNFFGMTLYGFYYFLAVRINVKAARKVFYFSFLSFFFIALYSYFKYYGISRSYYSVGLLSVFFFLPYYFYFLVDSVIKNKIKLVFYFSIGILAIYFISIFVTDSKGYLISFIFSICLVAFVFLVRSILSLKLTKQSLFLVGSGGLILVLLSFTDFYSFVFYIISNKEPSNSERALQAHYLLQDSTFWGHGLGATLSNGFERDTLGYGFETTYQNLIHKLGFVAILNFFVLLVVPFVALKNLILRRNVEVSLYSLGLMCYLIPAYGNPILYSPVCVYFHIVAIALLSNSKGS